MVDCCVNMFVIGAAIFTANSKDRYFEVLHQRSSHIVLGTKRVGCAENDICSACFQRPGYISRLSSYMQTG